MTRPDKQTVTLLVLDGWGLREETTGNAIAVANPPWYQHMLQTYPYLAIDASAEAVGLPAGQIGNSEVGHSILGAGRIIYQDLVRINKAIQDDSFFENKVLLDAIEHVKKNNSTLHLMGLVSDGGVHSDLGHLLALLDLAKDSHVEKVRVHAFLDGRDVGPRTAEEYLHEVEKNLLAMDYPQIATVSGRYYAMDRDNRWERTEQAYNNLVQPDGQIYNPLSLDAVRSAFENHGQTDEFVAPAVTDIEYGGMDDGDAVLFFNFRPDRARQLTRAFTAKEFTEFDRRKVLTNLYFGCMTTYDETYNLPVAFSKEAPKHVLGEIISSKGLKQLRTAETEKYAHVTFFFNGGREKPFEGEDRKLVNSPKVATYDLQPEMSLPAVSDGLVEAINSGKYDLIVANFANPDMVGHTGVMDAAVEAVNVVDQAVKRVSEATLENNGVLFVTADHGNIETMTFEDGSPHTAHTLDLVPLIMVSNTKELGLSDEGDTKNLSHVAPTILDLMNIEKPVEMTAESLLVKNPSSVVS